MSIPTFASRANRQAPFQRHAPSHRTQEGSGIMQEIRNELEMNGSGLSPAGSGLSPAGGSLRPRWGVLQSVGSGLSPSGGALHPAGSGLGERPCLPCDQLKIDLLKKMARKHKVKKSKHHRQHGTGKAKDILKWSAKKLIPALIKEVSKSSVGDKFKMKMHMLLLSKIKNPKDLAKTAIVIGKIVAPLLGDKNKVSVVAKHAMTGLQWYVSNGDQSGSGFLKSFVKGFKKGFTGTLKRLAVPVGLTVATKNPAFMLGAL